MAITYDAFFIPAPDNGAQKVPLVRSISAIQLIQKEDGRAKLGLLSQLAPGTTLERCGDGFNERTVKVRANGQCYFVFAEDLNSQVALSYS